MDTTQEPLVNGFYRQHDTGCVYRVISISRHIANELPLVIYCGAKENGDKSLARPLSSFLCDIITDGKREPRFAYLGMHTPAPEKTPTQ